MFSNRFDVAALIITAPLGFGPEIRQLDQAVAQFHRRPLRDDYVYIFLDGVALKMRDLAAKVRRRMVLVAYGVRSNGKRELLDYHFAHGKSEAAWLEFL